MYRRQPACSFEDALFSPPPAEAGPTERAESISLRVLGFHNPGLAQIENLTQDNSLDCNMFCHKPNRSTFMSQIPAILLFLSAFLLPKVVLTAQEGPAPHVPELKVLSNYIGTWDVSITSPDAPFAKGQSTAEWILDGMFVQQTGSLNSKDGSNVLQVRTLMTYDNQKKQYRMWQFASDGTFGEATGKWDAKTRTMTSIGHNDQNTTTTTAIVTEDGTEKWSIVTTNRNNQVVFEISGTNKRREK